MPEGSVFLSMKKWFVSSWPILCAHSTPVARRLIERGKEIMLPSIREEPIDLAFRLFVFLCRAVRTDVLDTESRKRVYEVLVTMFSTIDTPHDISQAVIVRMADHIEHGRCPYTGGMDPTYIQARHFQTVASSAIKEAEMRECEIAALESVIDDLKRQLNDLQSTEDEWTDVGAIDSE